LEYAVKDYGEMIADTVRMEAYHEALRSAVRPGSVVADIGTGTGIFALIACQLGADHVFAIEPSEVIDIARQCAEANGYADRITFYQARSTEVDLPRRADVVVSDMRGILPLYDANVLTAIDARTRFLAPGGKLIPARDSLWATVAEADETYARSVDCWVDHARGFDLSAARELVASTFMRGRDDTRALGPPACLIELDYRKIESPNVEGAVDLAVDTQGTAHGIWMWFDAELVDGVMYSNRPDAPDLVYSRAFFPFPQPVQVAPGDTALLRLSASVFDDDYLFAWSTTIATSAGREKAAFRQTTLDSLPLSPGLLRRSSEYHRPVLAARGRSTLLVLELMDGTRTIGEIADELTASFPSTYRSRSEALRAVTRLSQSWAR
jgi:protein arginine N-methyltransferase 1